MAEYIAFDPKAEVYGGAAMVTFAAFGEEATPIIKKHNMHPLEPDKWYPQQNQLNVLKEVSEFGLLSLVAVGMQIPDTAAFPPDIKSVEEGLNLLDQAYQMNHRGGAIGEYRYEPAGERTGKMIAHNPYPSDLDYGLIYRIVQKFRPADSAGFFVELDP
ncbi:MAG: hypothetical protein AAFR22_16010, partial [Chloroflexota bacterium]